ncbi:hypothetical protein F183_A29570 [Bryobacterales bacterium F-183]|nr:hypothetical protein F183_A29570 [Bryobacterales bacterium F-183]
MLHVYVTNLERLGLITNQDDDPTPRFDDEPELIRAMTTDENLIAWTQQEHPNFRPVLAGTHRHNVDVEASVDRVEITPWGRIFCDACAVHEFFDVRLDKIVMPDWAA